MKKISIVTACFNEEENIEELHRQVKLLFESMPQYTYEHIFIDNCSMDATAARLRIIAEGNQNVKVILNARNFGHIRSPYHALLNAKGDAVISLVADFQDPPEIIRDFLARWEDGYKIVIGIKESSEESTAMFAVRRLYYGIIGRLSDIEMIPNFTGFGLYDQQVIEILRTMDDPYPYFRGMIADIGLPRAEIPYRQPQRKRGITKNNFFTLYDIAMLGITNHSRVPLRLATMAGFSLSVVSLLVAVVYLVAKLIWWDFFQAGTAPILIGMFFFSSVQLFFIGLLGEYVGSIHTQILHRPLVVEKERINFD